jgi:hypothetical protein
MRSFLWRLRPDLAAVSLTLSSGTTVRAAQAALSSCQAGQWSGEVTAVTSALSTEGLVVPSCELSVARVHGRVPSSRAGMLTLSTV